MNEFCRIGLHSYGEWEDKGESMLQERRCRECRHIDRRRWEPDLRRDIDPYSDLNQQF